jgi:type I restriction enzyme, S subunit
MGLDGWQPVALGDVTKIKHGWPFKSELFNEELTGRPIIVSIGNFEYTGGFRFETTTLKEYRGDFPAEFDLTPGDILLVMTCQTAGGEILGIPGRIPDDGRKYLHNQRMGKVVITRPDLVSAEYLYWVFLWKDFNQELVSTASGTKIVHTAPSRIEAFKFDLPPLPEQQKIARILGALDDKIELNRRMNRTLEAMATALFKSWFVDFDPVTAKAEGRQPYGIRAETAALFPSAFQDSAMGPIPQGWRVGKVSDICSTQYGYTASASDEPVGPRFLRITDMNKEPWINWHTVPFCPISDVALRKYKLEMGDVLVSRMADPGKAGIVEEEVDAVFASYLVRLKTQSLAWSYYLFYFLKSDQYLEYSNGAMGGSVQAGMNARVIVDADMFIPPEQIVLAFSRTVQTLRKKIVGNLQESRTLASIRDALLPKLLSGEIRVKEAEHIIATA